MTTHLARLEADARERAMDPDLTDDDVLRAVADALRRPSSEMTGAERADRRAMLRGAMAAWLARTGTAAGGATDEVVDAPTTWGGDTVAADA